MANPSNGFPVQCTVTPVELDGFDYSTVTTAQTYSPNELIGVNASELADKMDDTQSLRFVGINAISWPLTITSNSSADERRITVKKPRYISMYIASATAGTDEDKPVYAAYSNEVSFNPGTYGNYVGDVKQVIDSTHVLIDTLARKIREGRPSMSLAATGAVTLTRNHMNRVIFLNNTAAQTITLPAVAKTARGEWLEFVKTTADAYDVTLDGNSTETINGGLTYTVAGFINARTRIISNGSAWYTDDGSNLLVGGTSFQTISNGDGSTSLTPASQILGVDRATASVLLASFNTTDTTAVAPSLNFLKSGNAAVGSNTTVANAEVLGEIAWFGADGTDFKSPAARIYVACSAAVGTGDMPGSMFFQVTADGSETLATAMTIAETGTVTVSKGFIPKSTSAAAITAARVLTAADSGGVFTVAKTGAYAITLPTPQQGLKFKFVVLDTGANAVTISDGSAHLLGLVSLNNTNTAMTGTTLTLASAGSVGDWVEFEGISATQYVVTGACISASDIAIA